MRFTKDDGSVVHLDYDVTSTGSATTYSPRYGADGGDPFEAEIISVWPATAYFDDLWNIKSCLELKKPLFWRTRRALIDLHIRFLEWGAQLTQDEVERAINEIAENYEPPEYDYYDDR